MLEEATKHIREAIMLGRTDILKKLLEEVKGSMTKAGKTALYHICFSLCNITYVTKSQILKMEKFNTTTFLMVCILR